MTLSLPLIETVVIVSTSQLQLVTQGGGQHSSTPIPKMEVSSRDGAKFGITLLVGNVAVVMCMLGAKTPVAHLPEGTLLLNMVGM